jgi:hypothetical protein
MGVVADHVLNWEINVSTVMTTDVLTPYQRWK